MQYIEISVSKQRDSASFFGKVMYRLHGYNRKYSENALGVDFPAWHTNGVFKKVNIGSELRIFGSRSQLTDFLLKTNLMEFLIEGGVTMTGVQDVPEHVDFVRVKRDNKIDKRTRMISDVSTIEYEYLTEVDKSLAPIALELGIDLRLATEMDRLLREKHKLQMKTGHIYLRSQSKASGIDFQLSREVVSKAGDDRMFSTYGLSKGDTTLPHF